MTTPQPAGLLGVRPLRIVAAAFVSTIPLMTVAQPAPPTELRALVMHRFGPQYREPAGTKARAILLAHRDYWARLAAEGKIEIGGRIEGGAEPVGLTLFARGFDIEQARRLAVEEPAVRAGYVVAEFRVLRVAPFFARSGSGNADKR